MDTTKVKKILLPLIVLLIIGTGIYFTYRWWTGSGNTEPDGGETTTVGGNLPGGGKIETGGVGGDIPPGGELPVPAPSATSNATHAEKVIHLTDFPVVGPAINKDESRIAFYKKDGGDGITSSFDGKAQEQFSHTTILGLIEAVWAPTKDRAVIRYLDGDTIKSFLHIGTSTIVTLPAGIHSAAWSPDGKSFAYVIPQGEALDLFTADANGKNAKKIFSSILRDASIQWVTNDLIAFTTAPSGFADGFLFVYSQSTGTLTQIAGPGRGFSARFSPDGARVLIGFTDTAGKNPQLRILTNQGVGLFELPFRTLPEKCTWTAVEEFYCGVPSFIPFENTLPDDYLRGELNTNDRIIRADLKKKETEEIVGVTGHDVSDLLVTKKKEYLFYANRVDGTLWSVRLKERTATSTAPR